MSDGQSIEPGWYDDPRNPMQERWWDGTGWGEQVRAKAGAAQPGMMPGQMPGMMPMAKAGDATKALVAGILGLVCCGIFAAIPAVIWGRNATRQIEASGGMLQGGGEAKAGLIMGWIGIAWSVVVILFYGLAFAVGVAGA